MAPKDGGKLCGGAGDPHPGLVLANLRLLDHVFFTVRGHDFTMRDFLHFLLLILVLYSASDFTPDYQSKPFKIIWNIPSEVCQDKRGIRFQETLSEAGITHNFNDRFYGDVSAIFYPNRCFWPRYEARPGGEAPVMMDGGLPQVGELNHHLQKLEGSVSLLIPDDRFNGVAIINMEEWRPLWARNWGFKNIYRTESLRLMRERYPHETNDTWITEETKRVFQEAARRYMVESLRLSRRMRPNGQWGYYHFPYCFNGNPPTLHCRPQVHEGNDLLRWLWEESSAVYPSIYLFNEAESAADKARYMYGNIEEGLRVASSVGGRPVYAYVKTKYNKTQPIMYYNELDMMMSLRLPAEFGIDGVILWGSMGDYQSAHNCSRNLLYLKQVIAPYASRLLAFTKDCARIRCAGRGRCVNRGAIDDAYAEEFLPYTMEKVNDFTIDERYSCRCFDGRLGTECSSSGAYGKHVSLYLLLAMVFIHIICFNSFNSIFR